MVQKQTTWEYCATSIIHHGKIATSSLVKQFYNFGWREYRSGGLIIKLLSNGILPYVTTSNTHVDFPIYHFENSCNSREYKYAEQIVTMLDWFLFQNNKWLVCSGKINEQKTNVHCQYGEKQKPAGRGSNTHFNPIHAHTMYRYVYFHR